MIITLPAYETYRSQLDSKYLDAMTAVAIDYADSNSNIKYMNYLSDDRFIKTDYRNADHLNQKGAKKLTQIINQEIEDWKSQQPSENK